MPGPITANYNNNIVANYSSTPTNAPTKDPQISSRESEVTQPNERSNNSKTNAALVNKVLCANIRTLSTKETDAIEGIAPAQVGNPWDLSQAEIDALKKLASEHQRQIPGFSESDDPKVREQEKEAFTKVLLEEAQRAKKEIYDKTGKVVDFSDSKPGSIASMLANNVSLARTKFYVACQELGLPFDQGQDYDMIKMQVDKFVSLWIQNT